MQKYHIKWTKSAELDLELIIEYIKIDGIDRAKKIFYEIKDKCKKLNTLPNRHKIVPELQQIGITDYKETIHKRWRIIYKVEDTSVYILSVVDSSRNLEDILFQRLLEKPYKGIDRL